MSCPLLPASADAFWTQNHIRKFPFKQLFDFLICLIFCYNAMLEDSRQVSYVNGTPVTVTVIFQYNLTVFANIMTLPSVIMSFVDSRYGCCQLLH